MQRQLKTTPQVCQRHGFTLIELLVVITIIAVLVAILLPAVQAAREAARLVQCRNNLKQMGLAMHNFHATLRAFPPANLKSRPGDPAELTCGGENPTWFVRLLPYLEQKAFAKEWNVWDDFSNHAADVRERSIEQFLCPTRRSGGTVCLEETVTFRTP